MSTNLKIPLVVEKVITLYFLSIINSSLSSLESMYPSRIVNLLQAINVNVDSLFNFSSSEVLYMYICRAGFRVHTLDRTGFQNYT